METAIIVPMPEAAPIVDAIRLEHTKAGREGAPAHVTLLIPFVDSDELTAGDVERAAAVVAGCPRFTAFLAELRYFEGSPGILYLAPSPADPFVQLTSNLCAAFPDWPPYGGVHTDVVPHATVAEGRAAQLKVFERELAPQLPIAVRVTEARLFERDEDARWHARGRLPLGA